MAIALRAQLPTFDAPVRPSLHVLPGTTPPGLVEPPADWESVTDVVIGEDKVDRVIVGPNGVFVVVVDPEPARLSEDGLIRDDERVKEPVKRALRVAHELGRRIGIPGVFAYPLLLAGPGVSPGYLGRLRVVGVDRLADALWCHPGRPLRRSERRHVIDTLAAESL